MLIEISKFTVCIITANIDISIKKERFNMTTLERKDITIDIIFKPISKYDMSAEEIIIKHKEVSDRYNSVWLGTDLNFSEKRIRLIDKNGHNLRVLFVTNETEYKNYRVIYSAELIDIKTYESGRKGTVTYDNNLIPIYYILDNKRCWLKLTNFKKLLKDEIEIEDYKLLYRRDEVMVKDSLENGQCCLMYVYKENV